YLKDNPDVALDIENQIRAKYNLPLAEAAPAEAKSESAVDTVSKEDKTKEK
ncbi:MAG: DNA recombination/repair protein RecA, partial [Clostridium butyricum]